MLSHYSTPLGVVLRCLVRLNRLRGSPSGQVGFKFTALNSISSPVLAPSQRSKPMLLHDASTRKIAVQGRSGVHAVYSAYRNERIRVAWSIDRLHTIFIYISALFLCFFLSEVHRSPEEKSSSALSGNMHNCLQLLVRVFFITLLHKSLPRRVKSIIRDGFCNRLGANVIVNRGINQGGCVARLGK